MNTFSRVVAAIVISLSLVGAPVQARFGGGGRSFGGGFGGGAMRSFGGGFGGGGFRPAPSAPPAPRFSPPASAPRMSAPVAAGAGVAAGGFGSNHADAAPSGGSFGSRTSAPASGGSFGGGGVSTAAPPPSGSSGSFGSRNATAPPRQSFGGAMQTGSTVTSNRAGIKTGASSPSTFTTNRQPLPPAPAYNGYSATYQNFGGRTYPVYYSSPYAMHSFYWLTPHPWYSYWNPFMPAFYFQPPYMYGGGYVPGGFNWLNLIGVFVVGGAIIWLGVLLFRPRSY